MSNKRKRDIEKDYPIQQFIEKLRRLADSLEKGERFEIQIAGERIWSFHKGSRGKGALKTVWLLADVNLDSRRY